MNQNDFVVIDLTFRPVIWVFSKDIFSYLLSFSIKSGDFLITVIRFGYFIISVGKGGVEGARPPPKFFDFESMEWTRPFPYFSRRNTLTTPKPFIAPNKTHHVTFVMTQT